MVTVPPAALSFLLFFHCHSMSLYFQLSGAHLGGCPPWCEVPTAPIPQRIPPLVWVTFQEQDPYSMVPLPPGSCHSCSKALALLATGCPCHRLPILAGSTMGQARPRARQGSPIVHSHTWLCSTQLLCITQLKNVRDKLIGGEKKTKKQSQSTLALTALDNSKYWNNINVEQQ